MYAASRHECGTRHASYQDIRLYGRALTSEEARRLPFEDYVAEVTSKPIEQWNADQWHAVSEFYFTNIDPTVKTIETQINRLTKCAIDKLSGRRRSDACVVGKAVVSVCERADARKVYTARTERVEANTPHYLPPLPAGEPHNRLALAKWTVSLQKIRSLGSALLPLTACGMKSSRCRPRRNHGRLRHHGPAAFASRVA